jgi:hypothetical protein
MVDDVQTFRSRCMYVVEPAETNNDTWRFSGVRQVRSSEEQGHSPKKIHQNMARPIQQEEALQVVSRVMKY